jgi:hypothetical protein
MLSAIQASCGLIHRVKNGAPNLREGLKKTVNRSSVDDKTQAQLSRPLRKLPIFLFF